MHPARQFLDIARANKESIDRTQGTPRPERVVAMLDAMFHAVESIVDDADPRDKTALNTPKISDEATTVIAAGREKGRRADVAKRASLPVSHQLEVMTA